MMRATVVTPQQAENYYRQENYYSQEESKQNSAWFKNLEIRVTLLEESKSFKSLCVKALRFWDSTKSVTLV